MSFGSRLRQLRNELGLTQLELAQKINLSKPNVSKYEADKIEPNIETLTLLSSLFDVTVDYLLCKTDNPSSSSLNEKLSGIDFALYAEAKTLSEEEKQDVLDYIQYKKAQKEKRKNNVYLAAFGGAVHGPEENKTPETAREIFQEMRNEEN